MATSNIYNPNPRTVDSILRERQVSADLNKESGLIQEPQQTTPQTFKVPFLGTEITPEYKDKSFLRKVGEDAAMLAYAIPTAVAKAVTSPIEFAKEVPGAFIESAKETIDPDFYKAHPLLGIVNLAGFVSPIAGIAKSMAIKTTTKMAINTALKEATSLGVKGDVVNVALKTGRGAIGKAVTEAAKLGKVGIVEETVRNLLVKSGVAEDVSLNIARKVTDGVSSDFARQTTKMKVMESIAHPLGSGYRVLSETTDPIRKAVFGDAPNTAVGILYGEDAIKKNPQGFLDIERWSEAIAKEQGIEPNLENRLTIQRDWIEKDRTYATLNPEQRVVHFRDFVNEDFKRKQFQNEVGGEYVLSRGLSKNTIDSMVETINKSTFSEAMALEDLVKIKNKLADVFHNDFYKNEEFLNATLKKTPTKEALINAINKLGESTSLVDTSKLSVKAQQIADELIGKGYRIGYAPKGKVITQAADIVGDAIEPSAINLSDITRDRTTFSKFLDRWGFSTRGVDTSAVQFAYSESYNQRLFGEFAEKHGGVIKVGDLSIPVEKLYDWLDRNRLKLFESRKVKVLPIRSVFDIKASDLVKIGVKENIANALEEIGRKSLREIPTELTGVGDMAVNYLASMNNGFGTFYKRYQQTAFKGRYDWSPFFAAQQWLETRLNSSLLVKDIRTFPGVAGGIKKLGDWTPERLAKQLEGTQTYLKEVLTEPTLNEVALVQDEILGSMTKTMVDVATPDIMNVMNAAKGGAKGLADIASFEESIRSRNVFYKLFGQSSVRMATTMNKALAYKFGMTLEEAGKFTSENGIKKYANPQMLQIMKESTQSLFHYKTGFLTSPLMKTMNIVWFPLRFQVKSAKLLADWMGSLSPMNKMILANNWVHFANWTGTEEGIKWRRTNRNALYNILAYSTSYEQSGQAIEAVTNGRLFGGNAGLIGGVPFGVIVNIARELAILPEDPDQFDPKTGRRFTKTVPKEVISAAALSTSIEQLLISMSPSTPFYSLTGGVIGGVSPSKQITLLTRQIIGATREAVEGREPARGKQMLDKDFKRVPLEYTRLAE